MPLSPGALQNKIVHVAHLNASGFKFAVLPNAFIVHRNHEQTSSRESIIAGRLLYQYEVLTGREVNVHTMFGHTKSILLEAKVTVPVFYTSLN